MHDCSLISHHRTCNNDYEYDNPSNDFFLAQAQASWMHEESQHKYLRTNIEAQFSWCIFFSSFWRSGSVMVDEKGTHSKDPPPIRNYMYTIHAII